MCHSGTPHFSVLTSVNLSASFVMVLQYLLLELFTGFQNCILSNVLYLIKFPYQALLLDTSVLPDHLTLMPWGSSQIPPLNFRNMPIPSWHYFWMSSTYIEMYMPKANFMIVPPSYLFILYSSQLQFIAILCCFYLHLKLWVLLKSFLVLCLQTTHHIFCLQTMSWISALLIHHYHLGLSNSNSQKIFFSYGNILYFFCL